jgi:hypothetical protein
MAITTIRGQQVLNGTIARADLNVSTVGQAVVAKLIQGTNVTLSSTGGDAGTGDVTISSVNGVNGFISKTAAYTLTSADSNKYIICSNGSWTLTLPSAALGLCYSVRNDQTCFGTTGTITIQPPAGTINGAASLALLPCQECLIVSDGTNWRTFGLNREVVLGTQDITSSTASAFILLPVGFRYFELIWDSLQPATISDQLTGQFSSDGGSTWLSGAIYLNGLIYSSSATAVAYSNTTTGTAITLSCGITSIGQVRVLIYPGGASRSPSWIGDALGYVSPVTYTYRFQGFYNANLTANALKYYFSASNIINSFLTVKGVV